LDVAEAVATGEALAKKVEGGANAAQLAEQFAGKKKGA